MLVPLEIVVKFSPESQAVGSRTKDSTPEELFKLSFLERLETTKLVQEKIEEDAFGRGAKPLSAEACRRPPLHLLCHPKEATSPPSHNVAHTKCVRAKSIVFLEQWLSQSRQRQHGTVAISLRVAAFQGVDYGDFVKELQGTIDPILKAHQCRLEILRQLAREDRSDAQGARRVLLWDTPRPKALDREDAPPKEIDRWNQQQAMVEALGDLLTKDRLKVMPIEVGLTSSPS